MLSRKDPPNVSKNETPNEESKESNILNFISIISKDKKLLKCIQERAEVRERLKKTMDKEQLELFASFEAYTVNALKNGLDQITGII